MGSGGIQGMITSLKNNKRAKRNTVFDNKTSVDYIKTEFKGQASKYQLDEIREKLALEKKKEQQKTIKAILIALPISIIIIYLIGLLLTIKK